MAIDPKRIAEYRALLEKAPHMAAAEMPTTQLWAAVAALLSEREEMQREIKRLRSAPRVVGVTQEMRPEDFEPLNVEFVPAATTPDDATRLAEALAVLRSVEWGHERMTTGYPARLLRGCPECGGLKPESETDVHGTGHFDDCRLAALLRGA